MCHHHLYGPPHPSAAALPTSSIFTPLAQSKWTNCQKSSTSENSVARDYVVFGFFPPSSCTPSQKNSFNNHFLIGFTSSVPSHSPMLQLCNMAYRPLHTHFLTQLDISASAALLHVKDPIRLDGYCSRVENDSVICYSLSADLSSSSQLCSCLTYWCHTESHPASSTSPDQPVSPLFEEGSSEA